MAAASALPSLRPQSSGSASGPTAVFVHGWPDDASLLAPMAAHLERDFHCVRVTLPNFGPAGPGNVVKHSGYSFEVLAEALAAIIIDTQRARGRPDEVRALSPPRALSPRPARHADPARLGLRHWLPDGTQASPPR